MSEQNNDGTSLSAPHQKRKYTKHDYFSDLDKKVRIWKSILGQFERINESNKKRKAINLSATQEEVSKYIANLAAKEGRLLSSSGKIQKLYTELQELANKEADSFIFDYSDDFRVKNLKRDTLICLIDSYNDLQSERKEQNQRIQDIQALINFEKRQIQTENERKKKQKNRSNSDAFLLQISSQRILTLYRRIRKDQNEIKTIQLGLQKKAKELFQVGQDWFSEKVVKECIAEFKEIYSDLENALTAEVQSKKQLETALDNIKKAVEQEKTRLTQQRIPQKIKLTEKTPEEKIQDGFDIALSSGQNLIFEGKGRSLGLTNAVIEGINDDEEYKQDIIDHIKGLLDTPQGQDFGKSGNGRWKPVQGRDLYELSVCPKIGHTQNMPRFYAKKEIFVMNGAMPELTNNKDKRATDTIWVLVKKGSKGDQTNDINAAEKIFFKNDGRQRCGLVTMNSLGWVKVSLVPNTVPSKMIGHKINSGRE